MNAAVNRLEDAARRCAGVIDVRLPRNAGDRGHAVADRTDVSVTKRVDIRLLRPRHLRRRKIYETDKSKN